MKKLSSIIIASLFVSMPLTALAKEGGSQTALDIGVTSASAWKVLSSKAINVVEKTPNVARACSIVGSADVKTPAGAGSSQYRFTLTLDKPAPGIDGACERTLSLTNSATSQQIGSTCFFTNVSAGTHTVYWLARKATAAAPNVTVTDNSFTVSCADNPL